MDAVDEMKRNWQPEIEMVVAEYRPASELRHGDTEIARRKPKSYFTAEARRRPKVKTYGRGRGERAENTELIGSSWTNKFARKNKILKHIVVRREHEGNQYSIVKILFSCQDFPCRQFDPPNPI